MRGEIADGPGLGLPLVPIARAKSPIAAFHRFQMTSHSQLSLGAQGGRDPINTDDDALAVFTVRLSLDS